MKDYLEFLMLSFCVITAYNSICSLIRDHKKNKEWKKKIKEREEWFSKSLEERYG